MSGPGMDDEILFTLGLEDDGFSQEITVSEEALQRLEATGLEMGDKLSGSLDQLVGQIQQYARASELAAMRQGDANERAAAAFAPLLAAIDEVNGAATKAAQEAPRLFAMWPELFGNIQRAVGAVADRLMQVPEGLNLWAEAITGAERGTAEFTAGMARLQDTIDKTNISGLSLIDGGGARLEGLFAHLEGLATGDADALARLAAHGVEVEDAFAGSGARIADYVNQLDALAATGDVMTAAAQAVGRLSTAEADLTAASDRKTASMRRQSEATDADAQSASFLDRALALLGVAFERVGSFASSASERLLVVRDSMFAADAGTRSFGAGLGEFALQMAGFSLLNRGVEALRNFGDAAIGGNIALEKFKQQLVDLTGSEGAAQKLIDFTWQFGRQIPFTTESLQQATLAIAALGNQTGLTTDQEQKIIEQLAQVASATGTTLPNAARAFFDAFSEHRWLMMMTQLKVSKEEMRQYGLEVDKSGKFVESTFLPAWDKLVAAKFPATNLTQAMHEFWGETSNLTDQFQQLAIVLGKPIFVYLEDQLFKLETWIQNNRPELERLATAIGTRVAGAVSTLVIWIQAAISWFERHHQAAHDLADLLGGLLLGVVIKLGVAVAEMAAKFVLGFGPWGIVGSLILLVFRALKDLYDKNPDFRQAIDDLGAAAGRLFAALKPFAADAGKIAGGLLKLLEQILSSPQAVQIVRGLAGGMDWLADALTPVSVNGQPTLQFFLMIGPAMDRAKQALQNLRDMVLSAVPILVGAGSGLGVLFAEFTVPGGLAGLAGSLTGVDGVLTTVVGHLWEMFHAAQGFMDLGLAGGFVDVAAALAPVAVVAGAVAFAVGSVVAAFLYWWQNSSDFRSKVGDLLGVLGRMAAGVGSAFAGVGATLANLGSQLGPSLSRLGESLQKLAPFLIVLGTVILVSLVSMIGAALSLLAGLLDGLATFLSGVANVLGGVIQAVSGVINFIVDTIGGFLGLLGDVFSGASADKLQSDGQKFLQRIMADLGDVIGGLLTALFGLLQMTFGTIFSFLGGTAQSLGDWWYQVLRDIPVVGGIMKFVGDLLGALGAAKDWIIARLVGLKDAIASAWGDMTGQTDQAQQKIARSTNKIATQTQADMDQAAADARNAMDQMQTDVSTKSSKMTDDFGANVLSMETDVQTWAKDAVAAAEYVASLTEDKADLTGEHLKHLGEHYTNASATIDKATQQIHTSVDQHLGDASNDAYTNGSDLATNFANGMQDNLWRITQQALAVSNLLWQYLHFSKPETGPLADFDTYGPDMVAGLAAGIEGNLGRLRQVALDAASSIAGPLNFNAGGSGYAAGGYAGLPASSLARGFGAPQNVTFSVGVTLNGGIADGWRMLSGSQRREFATLVGQEMGHEFALHSNTFSGWANDGQY